MATDEDFWKMINFAPYFPSGCMVDVSYVYPFRMKLKSAHFRVLCVRCRLQIMKLVKSKLSSHLTQFSTIVSRLLRKTFVLLKHTECE